MGAQERFDPDSISARPSKSLDSRRIQSGSEPATKKMSEDVKPSYATLTGTRLTVETKTNTSCSVHQNGTSIKANGKAPRNSCAGRAASAFSVPDYSTHLSSCGHSNARAQTAERGPHLLESSSASAARPVRGDGVQLSTSNETVWGAVGTLSSNTRTKLLNLLKRRLSDDWGPPLLPPNRLEL